MEGDSRLKGIFTFFFILNFARVRAHGKHFDIKMIMKNIVIAKTFHTLPPQGLQILYLSSYDSKTLDGDRHSFGIVERLTF